MNWNDPAIWSIIIAFCALILSQLPPLRELVKGRKLKVTALGNFQLYHVLGNINITIFLDIHNIGGRSVSIDKLQCLIADEQNNIWLLPAQGYIPRSAQSAETLPEFPVGRIILKAGERWNENTHLFKSWTEADEENVSELIVEMRNDIARKLPSPDGKLVTAEPGVYRKAAEFFDRNFKLHKGNYYFLITALSENNSLIVLKGFEFTLYENHIRTLKSYTEDYKYGWGVYTPIPDNMKYLWIRLRLINDEKRTRQIYEQIMKKI